MVGVKCLTFCEPPNTLTHIEAAGHLLSFIYPGTRIAFSIAACSLWGRRVICYLQDAHEAIDELRRSLDDDTTLLHGDDLQEMLAEDPDFFELAESVVINIEA